MLKVTDLSFSYSLFERRRHGITGPASQFRKAMDKDVLEEIPAASNSR